MDFLDLVKKLQEPGGVGVEDITDKLNFFYSVILFMLCATVVTAKQYLMKPLACYVPTSPGGTGFDEYMQNYCWVHGTILIMPDEKTPSSHEEWNKYDDRRINYYQWIPFVLGLQCVCFYIPRVVWQIFCYNRTGTDLEHVVSTAQKASASHGDEQEKLIKFISRTIEDMLFQHRDFRDGRVAKMRRTVYKSCPIFIISKRLGTWLIFSYLFVKILYVLNGIGQIYVMKDFLGFNDTMSMFGLKLFSSMMNGTEYFESSRFFPRVTFCRVKNTRHLGNKDNAYTAQCALPVNMLSEKIYIFLWFWTVFVSIVTIVSVPMWLYRVYAPHIRFSYIRKLLRLREEFTSHEDAILKKFVREFLRHDGVFLLRMIAQNAGDVVAGHITASLWTVYKKKYRHRDLRHDFYEEDFNMSLKLEQGGQSVATFRKTATAPDMMSEKVPLEDIQEKFV